MSLALNEEQKMLQTAAQEFFAASLSVETFRARRDQLGIVEISQKDCDAMAELGWPAILVAEEFGGLNFGMQGLGMIAIEAGRCLAATPLQSTAALAVTALAHSDNTDLLSKIASGEYYCSFAQSSQKEVQISRGDGELLINGELKFVAEGSVLPNLILVHGEQEKQTLLNIDMQLEGIQGKKVSLIDQRDYAHLSFNNVKLTGKEVHELDQKADTKINQVGATMTACELFGITEEVFQRTLVHLREREQFGQKLGSFQALQHRMAKVYMQIELFKSVLYDALGAVEKNREDVQLAVSHAKIMANDVSHLACTEAIQMHGGMGITDELDIGLFYKRARVLRTVFGRSTDHQTLLASKLEI